MPLMEPPESGVKVRMYRQGQGDCFLLCFRGDDNEPVYLLIDCGFFPGSQIQDIQDVVDHIGESTGNNLNVVLISHEHMDHVNGFWSQTWGANPVVTEHFENIDIDRLWLAWTEDPNDEFANQLRERFGDTLLGLLAAEEQLSAVQDDPDIERLANRVRDLLAFEMGEDIDAARSEFMGFAIDGITNKKAIDYIRKKARASRPLYLRPQRKSGYYVPNVEGVRIYALGPPKDEFLIAESLDPVGGEGYSRLAFIHNQEDRSFMSAVAGMSTNENLANYSDGLRPFALDESIGLDIALNGDDAEFFASHYPPDSEDDSEAWRRIDHDWLHSSELIALRLDGEVNNTSLVVAIELPRTKKVLLFVGDAQRGNWISWNHQTWEDENGEELTAQDLLSRTVLYKVGHHGSHNATLKGRSNSDYANLNWMARGSYSDSFVAMIPANSPWAYAKGWPHPLRSIKRALMRKAKGRVFQTNYDNVRRSSGITDQEWEAFQNLIEENEMYFEYTVED